MLEAAFLQVLLLAKETGLLKVGNVSIDGTKIDANSEGADPQALPAEIPRREALHAKLRAARARRPVDNEAAAARPTHVPGRKGVKA